MDQQQFNKLTIFIIRLILGIISIIVILSWFYKKTTNIIFPGSVAALLFGIDWALILKLTFFIFFASAFPISLTTILLVTDRNKLRNLFQFLAFYLLVIIFIVSLIQLDYREFDIFLTTVSVLSILITIFRFSLH